MAKKIAANIKCSDDNSMETEDGEIDDKLSADIKRKEDEEIENYYLSLNVLGCDLRCSCCGDVFSDPVKLTCKHSIDRSCAKIKRNGNIIECFVCHEQTTCDDVDNLLTNFEVAAKIPVRPQALIDKYGGKSLRCDESLYRKRKRRTRWDKNVSGPGESFSGAVMNILSSNNLPKNITMSHFKKFSEISGKPTVMNMLTKTVLETVNGGIPSERMKTVRIQGDSDEVEGCGTYSDVEILEMIPWHEFDDDLFELEKTQLILLYRDALDKGVVSPPTPSSTLSSNKLTKAPLLPTPKRLSNSTQNTKHNLSPESPTKSASSPSSSRSSVSDFLYQVSPSSSHHSNFKKENNATTLENEKREENFDENYLNEMEVSNGGTKKCSEEVLISNSGGRYRECVARLHSIYSAMYHASLKMKEFESDLSSPDYQSAYKIYSANYSEYQTLYSSIQTGISIDSVVTETSDSTVKNEPTDKFMTLEQVSSIISRVSNNSGSTEAQPLVKSEPQIIPGSVTSIRPQDFKPSHVDTKNKFGYLWISNLSKETRITDLCKVFGKFGHISKLKLFQYKAQSPATYFSLIFMPNFNEAEHAYRTLQNTTLLDRQIHIKMLSPPS